jgi:hypothetical protein
MQDGTTTAVLVFPDTMTEHEALVCVEMDQRELSKLGEIHNEHEGMRACQYHVVSKRGGGKE